MSLPQSIIGVLPSDNELVLGIVASINPLVVNVRGGTVNEPGTLGSYLPGVGDSVQMLRQDATWLILGASGSSADATDSIASFGANTPAATTAGAGYSNVTGARLDFVKRFESTRVRVDAAVGSFVTTNPNTKPRFGFDFINMSGGASVRVDMMEQTINPVSTHTTIAGHALFSGIGAGTYDVQLLWLRVSGTGTLNINADDWVSFTVEEVS